MPKMLSQECLLIQFAKCPELGQVKTRMQPHLTQLQSLRLHQSMLEYTLKTLSVSQHCDYQLALSGEVSEAFDHQIQRWRECYGVAIAEQQGDDLGQRMFNAIAQSLQSYAYVCLIGSDCPLITTMLLQEVFMTLQQADERSIVITPAYDGGYVLIAMSVAHKSIFNGIDWGSERVYEQTKCAAEQANLTILSTEALPDIDEYADLCFLPPALQAAYT